mgnify:CR=1 FL=1
MGNLKPFKKSYLIVGAKKKINMFQKKEAKLITANKNIEKIKEKLDRIIEKNELTDLDKRLYNA